MLSDMNVKYPFMHINRINCLALFLPYLLSALLISQFDAESYPSNYDHSGSSYDRICFASESDNTRDDDDITQTRSLVSSSTIEFVKENINGFELCSFGIDRGVVNDSIKNADNGTTPDSDCMFDPSLPKCAVDESGNCPEGFGRNAYHQCFPLHYEGCPKGYHSHQDDESGRCIPNSEKCEEGYIIAPNYPECQDSESVCKEFPNTIGCKPNNASSIVTTDSDSFVFTPLKVLYKPTQYQL